jgi:hypothetical protein
MTTAVMAPDERALREHLGGARFQVGVEAGRWRLISLEWPIALIAVSAAPRPNAPTEFVIRLDLAGYPHTAPTGGLWDLDTGTHLATAGRPKGDRAAVIFRNDGWAGGAAAMYAAWDRIGLQAHPEWAQRYPRSTWNASRDLTFILSNVHEVLTADDYLGV